MEDFYLRKTKLGISVFSNKNYRINDFIIGFKGEIIDRKNLPIIKKPEDDRYVQIGKKIYLGPSNGIDDYFNHSCDPNSALIIENNDNVKLIAIKEIFKGDEIMFDYSTTMDEDNWEMVCKCMNENCRGKIKDFIYLPKNIQQKYINLGIIPKYILDKLLIEVYPKALR